MSTDGDTTKESAAPTAKEPAKDPTHPKPWLPMHMACPRCAAKPKAQVTPKFSRILVIQCGKCGWRLDLEVLRKALKTEHFQADELSAMDEITEEL